MTAKVSCCNVHVHPMPHSVTEAGRDPIFVLCNYSPVHKCTTLPPTVMMVIQVYSGVLKAVLYVDERAYEQFCNKLWHRSVFCGVSHTIYTDCWLHLRSCILSQEVEIRELSMKANLLSDLGNNVNNRSWYITKGWHRYSKGGSMKSPVPLSHSVGLRFTSYRVDMCDSPCA